MRSVLQEFRDFILRGNVIDLAVAVVIGAAFTTVVTAAVTNLITPLIAALIGEPSFAGLSFAINGAKFGYGAFLDALLTFLLVAAVVFFVIVKPMNLLLDRRRAEPATAAEVRACPECLSDIPVKARRCAFCTAEVGATA